MKRLFIVFVLFLTTTTVYTQDPLDSGWLWAERGGSGGSFSYGQFDNKYERVVDVAVDGDNNYYYLAEVGGYAFEFGDMEFESYNDNANKKDIFVFSTDSEGIYRWGKVIGGGAEDFAASLVTDQMGNIYISGTVFNLGQTPVHFDMDTIMDAYSFEPSPSNKAAFLIKYDSEGNFQWLQQPEENAVMGRSGAFVKTIVMPNGQTHSLVWIGQGNYFNDNLIVNEGQVKFVILKYDSDGNLEGFIPLDMKPNGQFSSDFYNYQFAYDHNLNQYYIADTYRLSVDPDDPLSINGYGVDTPNKAFYLAAVDNQGEVVWYHENEKVGSYVLGDLQIDDTGDIYITGYLSADQGPDNFAGFVFDPEGTNSGKQDPFLVKLNSDGNLLWSTNANLFSPFLGQSIVVDGNNVYLGLGMVNNTWDGLEVPGPVQQGLIPDIQIIRFDAETGVAQEVISNNAITPTRDAIMAMALDNNGDLVVGGYFGSTLFGGTDLQIQNTGPDSDFFIAKYQPQDTGVGINEASVLNKIKVYPNPTSGMLNLQSQVALTSYTLFDLQGRIVKQASLATNQVDLSGLESGVYVLGVRGVDGNVWNTKVVIE
ncbi:T9SS type A sorting domain-containing protein [Cryomorpha ignava]|uniref:T9SS type A sorting domain-containing protein n=1 Tax=Cryomorpha ignava TaxID=101383 RepID=A0A7K3WVY8_9FLAO|nr:T9SS type A sorting domain-containing protein [Cryomorpha ignava]NEN25092.1 T9SS type A sorting domain-containing protein [Cryomorpha ignava]